ncbi:hypothetical protein SEA_ZARTROSA_43 [Arthrobacter phage Zartrosa]|uniref:Uncharacterized protein n=1 Tax=Arthrobacter phage Zartrosa TaxID=2603257 RepID=A0A5B8WJD5_9CAUD|nr:hypothetical protein HYP98_gp43 [Arthrobacter phage Zartrosa]QED11155.1 hypothetical protein SEA_ZARTROSA_43 [Arthrobacter phage Zartrosa]
MPASPEATNVADARAQLYRIKRARQPITEAIDHLREHVAITQNQLEDTQVVDTAMQQAEERAQAELDQALEQHEDAAAERLRLQIKADELRRESDARALGFVDVPRKISDNPQA